MLFLSLLVVFRIFAKTVSNKQKRKKPEFIEKNRSHFSQSNKTVQNLTPIHLSIDYKKDIFCFL